MTEIHLTTTEAARALRMSRAQLLELVARGEIPCKAQGPRRKVRRFRLEDLDRWSRQLEDWQS